MAKINKKKLHKINNEITHRIVKLIIENESPRVLSIEEALQIANDKELDLVLVGETVTPPVVKLMNYSKFLYDLNKNKNSQKTLPLKEVRFTPNTGESDLTFKLKHIQTFLEKGHKVKAFVFFKGRELAFKDRGEKLLLELALKLENVGIVDSMPKLEGKKMIMMLKPKEKK